MPSDIHGFVVIGVMLTILGAPIWVPPAMLAYHWFTAKTFWRFSLLFLFALTTVECVALVISVAFYRFLTFMFDNWPVPG